MVCALCSRSYIPPYRVYIRAIYKREHTEHTPPEKAPGPVSNGADHTPCVWVPYPRARGKFIQLRRIRRNERS